MKGFFIFMTTTREGAVRSFEDIDALSVGLDAKAAFEPVDLYPRDGSETLGEVEAAIAHLARTATGTALAFGSGMSATTAAIEMGLSLGKSDEKSIAHARDLYSQTQRYTQQWLQGKRVAAKGFDSNYPSSLERAFKNNSVILTETIGNYLNVPVLDIERLLELQRQFPDRTTIIDHTFPLSTGLPIAEHLTEEDRIIVVESGTKAYTFNEETLGVAYTKHPELLDGMRRWRRTVGSLLGVRSLQLVGQILPTSRDAFDKRNMSIFSNTLEIAQKMQEALDAARESIEPTNDPLDLHGTSINHPGLDTHDDHAQYSMTFTKGGVPAFYIYSQKTDQKELARRLWSHPDVRAHVDLGQSFGFDRARMVFDENAKTVRIAGGAKTDAEALGKALGEALTQQTS